MKKLASKNGSKMGFPQYGACPSNAFLSCFDFPPMCEGQQLTQGSGPKDQAFDLPPIRKGQQLTQGSGVKDQLGGSSWPGPFQSVGPFPCRRGDHSCPTSDNIRRTSQGQGQS